MGRVSDPGLGGRGNRLSLALILALAVQAFGASQLQGPSLGVLFDSASGQLKPMIGIPGAAAIGQGFEVQALSAAVVCSAHGFALGVARESGQVLVISFGSGTAETAAIPGAPSNPDRMILSPSCTSAALLYGSALQAQLITGLPSQPSLSAIDLSALASPPGAMAVDDTGAFLLAATSTKGTSTVNRLSARGQPELVANAAAVSAVAFLRNSPDAVVADSGSNQLLLVRNAAYGPPTPVPVAGKSDGILDAAWLAVSGNNRHALIANATNNSVAIIDLASQSSQQVQCTYPVEGISPLQNNSIFGLSGRTDRPITILDVSGAQPRLSLVPSEPPNAKENGQ